MIPSRFLRSIWHGKEGYYCLSTKTQSGKWKDHFFQAPIDYLEIRSFIDDHNRDNLYFCPTALKGKRRKKDMALPTRLLWADLDAIDPRSIEPKPQIAWESSPGRYACLWILNDTHSPEVIERTNRALTYAVHADKSGWDLTQVLRLPGTRNYKYPKGPRGRLMWERDNAYALDDFPTEQVASGEGRDPRKVYKKWRPKIKLPTLSLLTASTATQGKRSDVLYRLERELHEQGVPKEDIATLIKGSVWNKFRGRPDEDAQIRRELDKLPDPTQKPLLAGINGYKHDRGDERPLPYICMDSVEAESVRWIWYPYIPRGKLVLIEGDPDLGKSWLTLALASHISTRTKFPNSKRNVGGKVLLFSSEDGKADTIRPRLDMLKANVKKVFLWEETISFDEDGCEFIEHEIERLNPVVVIIDPLVAYIGSNVDMHKANETRPVLDRLARIAEKHEVTFLVVRHLTKGGRDKAIYRGMGSIDILAASRSVLLVGRDPEDEDSRAIVHIRSSLAPKGPTLKYELRRGRTNPFRWAGTCKLTAEEVMKENKENGQSEYNMAREFLKAQLEGGPKPSDPLKQEAEARGITLKVLSRVAQEMNVIRGGGLWRLG